MTQENLPADRGAINPVTWDKLRSAGVPETVITNRDLFKQHLSQADLSGCDLRGFIFKEADCIECNFIATDLRGIQFASVDCTRAQFRGADLRGVDLSNGCFFKADFGGSDLRGANIVGGLLGQCDFSGADLRHAYLGSEIRDANLRGSDLRGINIAKNLDLKKLGCILEDTVLSQQTPPQHLINKRRSKRYVLSYLVSAFEIPSMQQLGTVINISYEGFKLACSTTVQKGREYKIRLVLPRPFTDGNVLEVSAACRWKSEEDIPSQPFAGFQITDISESGGRILGNIIDEHEEISER